MVTTAEVSVESSYRTQWHEAIAEFGEWARLRRYPETTIRTRADHLRYLTKSVAGDVGPWDITGEQLLAWFAKHDWAANTYRSRRTTMRAFYAWALETERIVKSPASMIPRVDPPPPNPMPCPDRVYDNALLEADDRVELMLELAAGHGLRRGEVAVVYPERDLIEDLEGWSLIVHGKGGKTRIVPLVPETASKLRKIRGWAFPGRINGHLSPQRVGNLVSRSLEGGWTMHKLRHRAGTYIAEDAGGDMRVVQEILGHAGLNTTMLYVPANQKRMRDAVRAGRSTQAAAHDRRAEVSTVAEFPAARTPLGSFRVASA